MTARRIAYLLVLGIAAEACAKDTETSVYLEVANGTGAPSPAQVRIDIHAGTEPDAGADAGADGASLKSFPDLEPRPKGDVLGTLVIFPGAGLARIHITAQGLIAGQIKSQGDVDVTIVSRRQVTARITLVATALTDRDAGSDGPGSDDAGAPDVTRADSGPADGGSTDAGPSDAGATEAGATDAGATDTGAADRSPDVAPPPVDGGGGPPVQISVDFVGGGTPMTPAEQAGVVPATHWNSAASGVGTLPALVDSSGNVTSAAVSWNAGAAINTYASAINDTAGNFRMMNGYLDPTNGMVATITASALPATLTGNGYDVYVYTNGSVPVGETRTFNYAIGTATVTLSQTMAQIFSGTYVLAPADGGGSGNYVVFRNVRGNAFTLTATPGQSTSFFQRSPVNGFQIVAR